MPEAKPRAKPKPRLKPVPEPEPTVEERLADLETKVNFIFDHITQQTIAQIAPQIQGRLEEQVRTKLMEAVQGKGK